MDTDLYCKMSKKELNVIKDNPHTAQFFCHYGNISKTSVKDGIKYRKKIVYDLREKDQYSKDFTLKNYYNNSLERVLKNDMKVWNYSEIDELIKTTVYFGQRKLLISEIDFLTDFSKDGDVIVYAGAAPGEHISILIDMFPNLEYVLVDPYDGGFSKQLVHKSKDNRYKITLINDYFTDDMAKEFSKKYKNVLFISDIRTRTEHISDVIIANMEAQARWHTLIKSRTSMLKLRFPFDKDKMKYLDGEIRFQAWENVESTETRLIIGKNTKEKEYDIRKYEGQMYYFNRFTRSQCYDHNYKVFGMDHCYDCTCEFYIIDKYLKSTQTDFKNYKTEVISMYITQELSYCKENRLTDIKYTII